MMPAAVRSAGPCGCAIVVLAACALLPLGASPAEADEPAAPKPERNWSIELAVGRSSGGPTADIEDAMRVAGFDDAFEHGCCGDTSFPFTSGDYWSVWGAARRKLGGERWQVGVGFGWTGFDDVWGNRNVEGSPPESIVIHSEIEMLTIAPMAWFHPLRSLRFGAGPAMNHVDAFIGREHPEHYTDSSSWEPGLVVEAAVTAPVASRFYFLALLQYRWLQDGTVGPWQETASTGEVVVFPRADVTLSHRFAAVGLGIRF